MTEDQAAKDSQSDSGGKSYSKSKDKKAKSQRPFTKIILRRLPPTMTEEQFLEQVSPIPEHDHFYFAKPDPSLGNNLYSRAYINFVNVEDIYLFRDKFDGYIFLDERGVEYVGIVEYAPFQRVPKKKKKKDPKCGTIESDPVYQEFIENLTKDPEPENLPKLEYSYPITDASDKKVQSTPLLEYLAARKQDKRGRDERRRRENDKRKMRIERKAKDLPIKKSGDLSEDEAYNENYDSYENKNNQKFWYGEPRVYHKSKVKCSNNAVKSDLKSTHGSDEFINTDSDWDSHFPALTMKTLNTFTLTSAKVCTKKEGVEASQKSGGDNHFKEEEASENDIKKIKSRDWEKDKPIDAKDEKGKSETFRDKSYSVGEDKKKKIDGDKKDNKDDDGELRKNDKFKDKPREQKSKKYSDSRKERIKPPESVNPKQAVLNKMMSSDGKNKLNHDDIKPFTCLPHVKTDDLSKIIEGMDKKAKLEDTHMESKTLKESKEVNNDISEKRNDLTIGSACASKLRKNSTESNETSAGEDTDLKRQRSAEDRSRSTDREGSEEKERSDGSDRRTEKRIRNKDRPSIVIYQPGMGKFSKQRLAKEKDQPASKLSDSEKKDT